MPEFRKVARVADVPAGTGKKVEVDGKAIALFCARGMIYAVAERCPHRGGPLSEGCVVEPHVTCPWHGWSFDVTNGNRAGFPEGMGKITTYPVRIEGDDVLVEC